MIVEKLVRFLLFLQKSALTRTIFVYIIVFKLTNCEFAYRIQ